MEDKQQTPENTNRFQSSREDSSSPTRCAPRMPHSGLFPLHGAAHKQESCLQDSPPERRAFLYGKKSKRIAAWICILSLAALYRHLFNRHPGHSRLRQPVPYLPWRHYCPPHLIMDVSVALWPDKRKRKRHIKKCLRHFMKNLRFFLNLFPSGKGLSL